MKTLGKEYNPVERKRFLEDNADAIEQKGYMKPFTPEQLQGHKETLGDTMIEISAIEDELKAVKDKFKRRLQPLMELKNQMVANIKAKAEYVKEDCYKFVDRDNRITEYYNADGDMIEARPATADEMPMNMFAMNREAM